MSAPMTVRIRASARAWAPLVAGLVAATALTAPAAAFAEAAGATNAAAKAGNAATAVAAAPQRYRHYAGCGVAESQKPSHSCPKPGKKGAFFTSLDADVAYRICVKFPDGRRLCASRQHADRGEVAINKITSHMAGRHVVTWYVAGKQVGMFALRVHS
jgi:hypothetical protein